MGRKPSSDRPKPVGLPGLRARAVRGPKDGRWYWRAERTDKSVAWTGWATPKEVGAIVADLVAGGHAAIVDRTEELFVDFLDEVVRAYVGHLEDHRPDLKESSLKAYRLRVRQLRAAGVSGHAVERMNVASMEAVRAALLRSFSPRTAHVCIQLVGAAWTWCRREGLVPDRDLLLPKVRLEKKAKRTPTPAEIDRTIRHMSGWMELAALTLWGTGMRISELAELDWSMVNLEAGELRVQGKTGTRMVPFSAELGSRLSAWHVELGEPPNGPVMGRQPDTVRNLNRHLAKAAEKAKVPRFTNHGLRRAAVDALARSGVDVSTAAALLGHSPQVMLDYYRQVTSTDLRQAVQRARLGRVDSGTVVAFPSAAVTSTAQTNRTAPGDYDE